MFILEQTIDQALICTASFEVKDCAAEGGATGHFEATALVVHYRETRDDC